MGAFDYPIANVLQSEAGANAVMGSNMVLAERCSDVEGSKRMMLPCALPGAIMSVPAARRCTALTAKLTKSDISIPHPSCDSDLLVRGKSSHFVAGEQVPDNGR